ncbi:MAG: hypothetical protein LBT20_00840 [Clostridiales bacterium]|jgi:hypothetical protein|nr:hypothetical protein [Clostridiales bacterium]
MRNLTIQREKSIIACLAKIRIFIEDEHGDLILDGIKCKQIGVLKNGETDSYSITSENIKVFVVFSKIAPQKYHAVRQLEAGQNVELFTGPTGDPLAGNPFNIFTRQDLINSGIRGGWKL